MATKLTAPAADTVASPISDGLAELPLNSHNPSPARAAWRRLVRRRGALFGLIVIIAFAVIALAAPILATHDPSATSWSAIRKPPSAEFWLGTDELGRDEFSRVLWGARASLLAGFLSVALSLLLGVPIGLLAGYVGGWVDTLVSRFVDAMLAVPFLIFAISLAAFLGPSLSNAMVAIGISATPIFVRLTRAQVLAVKVEDYVEAARAVGNSHWRIALRHILPNVLPPLIIQSSLTIAHAIIAEASLSFLGLGQQPPAPSWGSMLNTAKDYIDSAPWMAVWPGVSIFLLVLSFNLLGDGLRDALDPRGR
jgi:peptide/nickel transport system permease protein